MSSTDGWITFSKAQNGIFQDIKKCFHIKLDMSFQGVHLLFTGGYQASSDYH